MLSFAHTLLIAAAVAAGVFLRGKNYPMGVVFLAGASLLSYVLLDICAHGGVR